MRFWSLLLLVSLPLRAGENKVPERIVSLTPSMTEILFSLGLGERVVGVTSYCDYPPEALEKPKVGSWAQPDLERIVAQSPDLVVSSTNIVSERFLKRLDELGIPIFQSEVETLGDTYRTILQLATVTGVEERGKELVRRIREDLHEVRSRVQGLPRVKVAFVVGHRDLVVVGGGSFLDELLRIAGGENIAGSLREAYAKYSYERIIEAQPAVIIDTAMGSEERTQTEVLSLWSKWPSIPAVQHKRIYGMETGIVLKPGPRVAETARALAPLLHPEVFATKSDARGTPEWSAEPAPQTAIRDRARDLLRIRLTRIACAAVAGAGLAIAGAAFQALLRNPLSDPYILGVSGGASLGAVAAIVLGLSIGWRGISSVPAFAFLGAVASMLAVYEVSRTNEVVPPHTLLMCGVIVNAFCGAFITILSYVAPPHKTVEIISWVVGGIRTESSAGSVGLSFALVLVSSVVLYSQSIAYNVMSFGEETSKQLGLNIELTKKLTFVFASLATAAVVSETGPIGFVGLIIPHIVRLLLGPDHRVLLPVCFLGGAAFLVAADALAHTKLIPVGAVTALCGGPFFLFLLRREKRRQPL